MDDATFISGNARGNEVFVPRCLPLPLAWLPYFMEKPRSHKEGSLYMTKQLGKISNPDTAMSKNITLILNWFKAACTRSLESPTVSILNVSSKRLPLDSKTVQWMLLHLQTVVPRQTRAQTPTPMEAAATEASREPPKGDPQRTDELLNRIIALSENVLVRNIDQERPNETAKKLS
jgi:hypothetical protein